MQFDFLKQFNPKAGERYVIVEQGRPQAVILSFDDYQKIANGKAENFNNKGPALSEAEGPAPNFVEGSEAEGPALSEAEGPALNFVEGGETEIDFNNEVLDNDNEIDNEDNKQKVAELKNELKRDLTLDDLPF